MNSIEALITLFDAILLVNKEYIRYNKFDDSIKDNETEHPVERVFTYELYHQWSTLLAKSNLVLNGEIIKCAKESIKYYPDFVLHGGQKSVDKQLIVCEVKRYCILSKENLKQDLEKLLLFTEGGNDSATFNHPFALGVFIVVGCTIKDLKTILAGLPNTEKYGNIICVTYNQDLQLQYARISDLENFFDYTKEVIAGVSNNLAMPEE